MRIFVVYIFFIAKRCIGRNSSVTSAYIRCCGSFYFFFSFLCVNIYYSISCNIMNNDVNVSLETLHQTLDFFLHFSYNIISYSQLFSKKIFFFSFLAAPQHMEFLGQGSNMSLSLDQSHSCSNTRSLTYRARPGIKRAAGCS